MNEPVQIPSAAGHGHGASVPRERGGLAKLQRQCRELALTRLGELLAGMLDQVDDALFELADKSVNNEEQTRYFDAMRDVRLKRSEIEQGYRRHCETRFPLGPRIEALADEPPGAGGIGASSGDAHSLSLVGNDELEETLAINNMVEKAEASFADELFALDQRMATLYQPGAGAASDNPVSPRHLCDAFRDAFQAVDTTIEIRLLVHKLFDKFVASALAELYQELNHFLANKGVLPTVRARGHAAPVSARGAARAKPRLPQCSAICHAARA
ncbi:MAG: DUF1631 family protein, partial [Gammaproteobacteria bacterium]